METELSDWVREHRRIASEEVALQQRKDALRHRILERMTRQETTRFSCLHGIAEIVLRYRLKARPEKVLTTLAPSEVLQFAQFSPSRVKELLVPRHPREVLRTLFEISAERVLVVRGEREDVPAALPVAQVKRLPPARVLDA